MKKIAIVGLLVAIVGIVFFIQCEKTEEISPVVETKAMNQLLKGTWYVKSVKANGVTYNPEFPISMNFSNLQVTVAFEDHGTAEAAIRFLPKDELLVESEAVYQGANARAPKEVKALGDAAYEVYRHLQGKISYSLDKEDVLLVTADATYVLENAPSTTAPQFVELRGTEWGIERLQRAQEVYDFKARMVASIGKETLNISWGEHVCSKKLLNVTQDYIQLDEEAFKCSAHEPTDLQDFLFKELAGRQTYSFEKGDLVLTTANGIKVYLAAIK